MAQKKASKKRHPLDPEFTQWHQRFPSFPGIERCLQIFSSKVEFPGNWQDVAWMEMTKNADVNLDEYIEVAKREIANGGPHAYMVLWTLASIRSPKCEELFESLVDHPVEKFQRMAIQGLKDLRKRKMR